METSIQKIVSKLLKGQRKYVAVLIGVLAVTAVGFKMARPALTMEREPYCGLEEHTHTIECHAGYNSGGQEEVTVSPVVSVEEKRLSCTVTVPVAHTHGNGCYGADGSLVCVLEEKEAHTHTQDCYGQSDLNCGLNETEGHIHGEECYAVSEKLICGIEEAEGHVHDTSCYTSIQELTCMEGESEGHRHGDTCYDADGNFVCGMEEAEGHAHGDSCYVSIDEVACGKDESAGHTHGEECYEEVKEVICEKAEEQAHAHTYSCYEGENTLICGKEELEEHTHGNECFSNVIEKENENEEALEGELICGLEEHVHTEECYDPKIMLLAEGFIDGDTWWKLDAEGALVIEATDTVKIIPDYNRTSMPWYSHSGKITSIKVVGMKKIGNYAFYGCSPLLKSVEIEDGVEEIGQYVFGSCEAMNSIKLPESLKVIGEYAFYYCSALTSIELPNRIEAIGANAFAKCTGLVSINIPNSVKTIGSYAFSDCSKLTEIKIPDEITEIKHSTFSGCQNLRNISLPANLQIIGESAFFQCNSLARISIPEGVTQIMTKAFRECENLAEVSFPESLQTISKEAFRSCVSLAEIRLPKGLTVIGNEAFRYCKKLETVEFGENIQTIGSQAFGSCIRLNNLILKARELNPSATCGMADADIRKVTIYCDSVEVLKSNVSSWWKAADISFQGPGHFVLESSLALGRPQRKELNAGMYYADEDGALYLLGEDGEATLVYVPDGLVGYRVQNRIDSKEDGGAGWTVTAVERDALNMAGKLQRLEFENPADITEIPDYGCGNCPSLAFINDRNQISEIRTLFSEKAVIGALAFHNTALEGGVLVVNNNRISIGDGENEWLGMSSALDKETGTGAERQLYTGEAAKTQIFLHGSLNSTDFTVARIYFSFDNEGGTMGYGAGNPTDEYEVVFQGNEGGYSYTVKVCKADMPYTYYYEIPRPYVGDTLSLTLSYKYNSPDSGGGNVKIWPVLLTDEEKLQFEKKVIEKEGIGCHQFQWVTKADDFPVSKSKYETAALKPSIQGNGTEDGSLLLKSLAYTIEMKAAGSAPDGRGKDYMREVDFSDTLFLPKEMEWKEGVEEAIEHGNCFWNSNCELWVYIRNVPQLLCRLEARQYSYEVTMRKPSIETDETGRKRVVINWNVKNNKENEMPAISCNLFFGDGMINVDIPENSNSSVHTYDIRNYVKAVQHFTYSEDVVKDFSCDRTVQAASGNCTVKKTSDFSSALTKRKWGTGFRYTITLENSGVLPYKAVSSVYDELSKYLYIRAADMKDMFDAAKEMQGIEKLTISIDKGTLCKTKPEGQSYYPGKEVIGTDGKVYVLSNQDTGIGTKYENFLGKTEDPARLSSDVSLSLSWIKGEENIRLVYPDPDTGEEKANEVNSAEIGSVLESLGYVVTYGTVYRVEWEMGDDFILYNGIERNFYIPVTVKDSFMLTETDLLEERRPDSFKLDPNWGYAKYDMGEGKEGTKTGYLAHINNYAEQDLRLEKGIQQNGSAIDEKNDMVSAGNVLTYVLKVTHAENPLRDMIPLVDRMSGAQALLVSKEGNESLADKGLREEEVNGRSCYVLSEEGEYTKVRVGVGNGYLADSVVVKKQANGELDTMIRWYLTDTQQRGIKELKYEAYVLSLPQNGEGGTFFSLSNESWLNDHQSHRLYDNVGVRGTNVEIEKNIVIAQGKNPSEDKLDEYSRVYEGDKTIYRLKIENYGLSRTITGSEILDILPEAAGFGWTTDNVDIRYYGDDGAYTLTGGEDWKVVQNEQKKWCIVWGDEFTLNLKETIYIYVTLQWPKGEQWKNYVMECGSKLLTNEFTHNGMWDKVSHDLAGNVEGYLQKGVYSSSIGGESEEGRFYYANKDWKEHEVTYYTFIYNSGYTKLYLSELQDRLPRGFVCKDQNKTNNNVKVSSITDAEGNQITPKWVDTGRVVVSNFDDGTIRIKLGENSKAGTIKYDENNQMYYLAPGEAVGFTYQCAPGEWADTDDIAANCIAMPYITPMGGRLDVADLNVEGPDYFYSPGRKNDGSCELWTTEKANKAGFTGGDANTQWLVSEVDMRRSEMIPGITKKSTNSSNGIINAQTTVDWEIQVTNSGNQAMFGYTLTDAMESPYGYIGTVKYVISDGASNNPKRVSGDLFQIEKCEMIDGQMHLTLKNSKSTNFSWKKNGTNVNWNQTIEVQKGDIVSVSYKVYSGNTLYVWEYEVGLCQENGKEELYIKCNSKDMCIPAGGNGTLTLSTKNILNKHSNKPYVNQCYITPVQAYREDKVSQGINIEHNGMPSVRNQDRIYVNYGFITTSQKEVKELEQPDNKATSDAGKKYILLSKEDALFRYSLIVNNIEANERAMRKLVLIDNLPEIKDHNTFNVEEARLSEFKVRLADIPDFQVMVKKSGERNAVALKPEQYRLEYTDKTEFGQEDWKGEGDGWSTDVDDIAKIRSIRVVIVDDGKGEEMIPAGASVIVEFNGQVDYGEGKPMPGTTAWNSFGYQYGLMGEESELNSSPLNVGVRLPDVPRLGKVLKTEDGKDCMAVEDGTFRFLIYNGEKLRLKDDFTEEDLADLLSKAGRKFTCVDLTVKKGEAHTDMQALNELKVWGYMESPDGEETADKVAGEAGAGRAWMETEEPWKWENGETYTIVELPAGEESGYQFGSMGGFTYNGYTFVHSDIGSVRIEAVNIQEGAEAFELPETGGTGIGGHILLGVLCLMVAGFILYKKRRNTLSTMGLRIKSGGKGD